MKTTALCIVAITAAIALSGCYSASLKPDGTSSDEATFVLPVGYLSAYLRAQQAMQACFGGDGSLWSGDPPIRSSIERADQSGTVSLYSGLWNHTIFLSASVKGIAAHQTRVTLRKISGRTAWAHPIKRLHAAMLSDQAACKT